MSKKLIANGYVVTVDAGAQCLLRRIRRDRRRADLRRRPGGADARRDRIRRGDRRRRLHRGARPHQHAPASLVHAVQGARRRLCCWKTGSRDFLLPLSLQPDRAGHAGVELCSPAWRCSRPAPPARSIIRSPPRRRSSSRRRSSRRRELGIRQVYAKELRCRTPGNPRHPLSLDEALADIRGGSAALGRRARRPRAVRHRDRIRTPIGSRPA